MAYGATKESLGKQPSKGAPRPTDVALTLPKEATRCPYSNPANGKESTHGTPREKL